MKTDQAKLLISANAIGDVVIVQREAGEYEVWLHLADDAAPVGNLRATLEVARGGKRLFSSLDAAIAAVRRLGWLQSVIVE